MRLFAKIFPKAEEAEAKRLADEAAAAEAKRIAEEAAARKAAEEAEVVKGGALPTHDATEANDAASLKRSLMQASSKQAQLEPKPEPKHKHRHDPEPKAT